MKAPTAAKTPHQLAWTIVNFSSVPVWLAMIIAPRARLTEWLAGRLVPLYTTLGIAYTASLGAGAVKSEQRIDFLQLESVQRALQEPNSMLAAWTHYIAFDLFVGRWIWETSLEEGKPARLAMLLTWWAGPMGLTLFLARRRIPINLP